MRLVKLSIHATWTALKINQMKADISWPTTTISVTGTGGKDWALVLLTRYTKSVLHLPEIIFPPQTTSQSPPQRDAV